MPHWRIRDPRSKPLGYQTCVLGAEHAGRGGTSSKRNGGAGGARRRSCIPKPSIGTRALFTSLAGWAEVYSYESGRDTVWLYSPNRTGYSATLPPGPWVGEFTEERTSTKRARSRNE